MALGAVALPAQSLPLMPITTGDGLSQGMAFALVQDTKGFIWAGTKDGLSRYDGYSFRVFRHDPFDTLTLRDNRIQLLHVDRSGRIWVSTESGLDLFDPAREVFHHVRFAQADGRPLPLGSIKGLTEDRYGAIWVFAEAFGLYRFKIPDATYDLGKLSIRHISTEALPPPSGEEVFIHHGIIEVGDDHYLVSDEQGAYLLACDSTGQKCQFVADPGHLPAWLAGALQPKGKKQFFRSVAGEIWFLGEAGGLRVRLDPFEMTEFQWKGRMPEWYPGFQFWNSVGRDGLLAYSNAGGIILYDINTDRLNAYPLIDYGFGRRTIGQCLVDQSGQVWFDTRGWGLLKSNRESTRFSESDEPEDGVFRFSGYSVRALLQLYDGEILAGGGGGGFFTIDPGSGRVRNYYNGMSEVFSFHEEASGRLWAAGYKLYALARDPQTGWRITRTYPIPKANYPHGCRIVSDEKGGLWIATIENLCRLDPDLGQWSCFDLPALSMTSKSFLEFPSIIMDPDGSIWVGTNAGLFHFDPVSASFTTYRNDPTNQASLPLNQVRSIAMDPGFPDRFVWIGTAGAGLCRLDKQTGTFKSFGLSDGLPDMVIYGILTDKEGHLWMSTNRGLAVMDGQTFQVRTFDVRDGLQADEFNAAAYARTQDGLFLFGGVDGFNRFRPEVVLRRNPNPPPVMLTRLLLSNSEVSVRQSGQDYPEHIGYAREIKIPSGHRTFSIEFAALDFTDSRKNQYAYRLEGFDADWQYIGTRREVTFTNLDPGRYTFHVKASNSDGVWNETGASVSLRILPPWYRTWWAYLFFAGGLAGFMFFLRYKEIQERELKHRLALEHVAAEKLKEVDQLKSSFFTNISHELRTPLTLMLGQLESINRSAAEEFIRSKAAMATRNGEQLMRLISRLLDLSKLEAGRMELQPALGDIVTLVSQAVDSFRDMAEAQGVSLEFWPESRTIGCRFDWEMMVKVMNNLLANAIKFTPSGGSVQVSLSVLSPSAQRIIRIEVADTGIGIPAAQLEQIFERYYQVNPAENGATVGTGIGLALVRELVQLHGGTVSAKSTLGAGSRFRIDLPMQEADLAGKSGLPVPAAGEKDRPDIPGDPGVTGESRSDSVTGLPGGGDPDSPPLVLLVEDHPDLRTFLGEQLSEAGYRVVIAIDGQEGLEMAREYLPDLIVTDVMMPRMDGLSFVREIRQDVRSSHIPVIILTARSGSEDKIEGLLTGVDDYLTKPFSTRELLLRVGNLIQIRRHLRERFSTATVIRPAEVSLVPMDQEFISAVLQAIEENMGESQFGVDALASAVAMSPTHLHRKLTALVGQAPGQLIRSMRLQRAADLLIAKAGTVNEIAYQVGFSIPENFSRSFRKHFGVAPSEYRQAGRTN